MLKLASPWAVSLFSVLLFRIAGAQAADSDAPLAKNTAIYILIGIAAVYFALTALCLLLVVCVCYCNHFFKKKSGAAPEKTEKIPLTPIKEEDIDEWKDSKLFGYSPLPTAPEKTEKTPLTPIKETTKKMDELKDPNPFGYSPLPIAKSEGSGPTKPHRLAVSGPTKPHRLAMVSGPTTPHRAESQPPPVGHFDQYSSPVHGPVRKLPSARKGRRHQEKVFSNKLPALRNIGAGVMNPGYAEELPTVSLLTNELKEVAHKWFTIGRELGIPMDILNSMKQLNTPDDELYLMNMCEKWLRIESNPSWTIIVAVLASTIIDERALARTIKEKYSCNDANYSPVVAQKKSACDLDLAADSFTRI